MAAVAALSTFGGGFVRHMHGPFGALRSAIRAGEQSGCGLAHGKRAVAYSPEHAFHARAERGDRRFDHFPALLLGDEPIALLILAAALGDVLVSGDPAAASHGPAGYGNEAAARDFPDVLKRLAPCHVGLCRNAGNCEREYPPVLLSNHFHGRTS